MVKAKGTAVWQEIDPATLSAEAAKRYKAYKEAYAFMKECRGEFEAHMNEQAASALPEGKRLAFGYNFGKLSVAVVDDDKPAKRETKPQGLAEWLAAQASRG